MLKPGLRSFVNYHPLPLRHGLTLGELALLLARELRLRITLELEPVRGWHRELTFDCTGLEWTAPSPNLRSFDAALLYPAVGMLEGTELSVGRGTDTPFELLGAPFVDAAQLTSKLQSLALDAVSFEPVSFTPSTGPFRGQLCRGTRIAVTKPEALCASCLAFALAGSLIELYGSDWQREDLIKLLGDRVALTALERGASLTQLAALIEPAARELEARRVDALRYPTCSARQSP